MKVSDLFSKYVQVTRGCTIENFRGACSDSDLYYRLPVATTITKSGHHVQIEVEVSMIEIRENRLKRGMISWTAKKVPDSVFAIRWRDEPSCATGEREVLPDEDLMDILKSISNDSRI